MKGLIVTIQSQNYGNRLQNYALQETLIKMNYSVESLPFEEKSLQSRVKDQLKLFFDTVSLNHFGNGRWVAFDRLINFRKGSDYATADFSDIDFFVAGSDQIWNPYFSFNSEREFLTFAPKNKRIAYAGSIGLDELPEDVKEDYAQNFGDFAALSSREEAGSKIIKDLIDRDVPVVLDPTMLLTANEWEELMKNSKIKKQGKFVVKYFLGTTNGQMEQAIEKYASDYGFEIIDVLNPTKDANIMGPIEFVWLLANSEFNFVDSFHGAVFSIIFNKHFYVFDRPSQPGTGKMSSRIDTLFAIFDLHDKRIYSVQEFDTDHYRINYEKVNEILDIKRNLSLDFLRNAIQNIVFSK